MKRNQINIGLITTSLITLMYYIFVVITQLFQDQSVDFMNMDSLFGAINVSSLFVINSLTLTGLKSRKVYTRILKSLLLLAVIFSSILFYDLLSLDFFNGENYFWKFSAIFFAIGSIVLIQTSLQKLLKNTN